VRALPAVRALVLKATLIIASGGRVDERSMAVLYLAGLAVALGAAIGIGLRRRRLALRVAVAVGLVALLAFWIVGLSDAVEPLFALLSNTAYVRDEAPVGAAGLAILLAAWWGYTRDQRAPYRT
jgi:hypothetical protein